jgi:hypothetical protein
MDLVIDNVVTLYDVDDEDDDVLMIVMMIMVAMLMMMFNVCKKNLCIKNTKICKLYLSHTQAAFAPPYKSYCTCIYFDLTSFALYKHVYVYRRAKLKDDYFSLKTVFVAELCPGKFNALIAVIRSENYHRHRLCFFNSIIKSFICNFSSDVESNGDNEVFLNFIISY